MKIAKRIIFILITVILLIALIYSIVQIWKIYGGYAAEQKLHQGLLIYKPEETSASVTTDVDTAETDDTSAEEVTTEAGNQTVAELKKKYPDAIGWLTIDGTNIDYPFVQSFDNQFYLRQDIDQNYLVSGTVFMDYRSSPDFSDFASILYGHQMKNGSMFGTMERFRDSDFFRENSTGRIYLPNRTLPLEVMAVLVISADDEQIYQLGIDTDAEKQALIDYISRNAEQLRADSKFTLQDNLVMLSTCVYDFEGARMVLVTRVVK